MSMPASLSASSSTSSSSTVCTCPDDTFQVFQDPLHTGLLARTYDLPPSQSTRRASSKWLRADEKENWDVNNKRYTSTNTMPKNQNRTKGCAKSKRRSSLELPVMPLADVTEAYGVLYVECEAMATPTRRRRVSDARSTQTRVVRRSPRLQKRRSVDNGDQEEEDSSNDTSNLPEIPATPTATHSKKLKLANGVNVTVNASPHQVAVQEEEKLNVKFVDVECSPVESTCIENDASNAFLSSMHAQDEDTNEFDTLDIHEAMNSEEPLDASRSAENDASADLSDDADNDMEFAPTVVESTVSAPSTPVVEVPSRLQAIGMTVPVSTEPVKEAPPQPLQASTNSDPLRRTVLPKKSTSRDKENMAGRPSVSRHAFVQPRSMYSLTGSHHRSYFTVHAATPRIHSIPAKSENIRHPTSHNIVAINSYSGSMRPASTSNTIPGSACRPNLPKTPMSRALSMTSMR